MKLSFKLLALLAFATVSVIAETHSVLFNNRCGRGTPALAFLFGGTHHGNLTEEGPLILATAYLDTGDCGPQGGNCTAVVIDLENLGTSCYISLIPPHKFSVPVRIDYISCPGVSAECATSDCKNASRTLLDNNGRIRCDKDNVSIFIWFC